MISNLHFCFYCYYSLRRISSPFIRCLHAVFGYKHFLTTINYFWRLCTTFDGCDILLSTTICYFWRLYTTFLRLYITFNGYILHLALRYCDFPRIQVFPAISFLCELNTRLEFNINLLALIQFSFFCNSMVSPVNFNLPFWKRCFIRNIQMLKMWNFQSLKKTDLDITGWNRVTVIVMYLRRLFSDKKITLVYSNALNQMNISLPSQWW